MKIAASHEYLEPSRSLDFEHPLVLERAAELGRQVSDPVELASRTFAWVRDAIRHSQDFQIDDVTCSASETLILRTGFCYAKAHLLVALLRANKLRAGLCYQRLRFTGNQYSLHGLCAVELPELGFYRLDPRGNKPGINAAFTPPREQLAFQAKDPGEWDDPRVWPRPLRVVTEALRAHRQRLSLLPELPDVATTQALEHAPME
ncbi:MAG TPA: transglutaminase family protein [Polyangiaceae bacterium]|jgi:transglutaminase-like putative cysteine protease